MLSRVLLFITGFLFIGALFVPMWQIQLEAPQYPEGLVLQLFANKLGGDVEVINGLNHYIGMATLHTDHFFEFKILPYIFGTFALLAFLLAFIGKKKPILIYFITFIVFVVLTAVDFYRWNYEYGHNLDPNAPIKVPGMAYQPPLLGYKQLLNFGAYSIPDTGGWLLIGAGILLLFIIIKEFKFTNKKVKGIVPVLFTFFFLSCNSGSEPIKLNSDPCEFCKMTISNGKFGTEFITDKGKVHKFDDIHCMIKYVKENSSIKIQSFYVSDYTKNNNLILAETAFYIKGGEVKSPMMGNCAAFSSENEAKEYAGKLQAEKTTWQDLLKSE